jgi:hypothetical protein
MRSKILRTCEVSLRAAVTSLASWLLGGPAVAVDADDFVIDSTHDLYDLCSAKEDDPQSDNAHLLCIGYFAGAIDYHLAVLGPKMHPIVCAPDGTTRNDVIQNFVAWAGARQSDAAVMDAPPIQGGIASAMDKWPCKP